MKSSHLFFTACLCLLSVFVRAEETFPFEFLNNSVFPDDQIYVAMVGKQNGTDIWIDFSENTSANPAIKPMNASYNTIHKTAGDWGYADIFTKLSDIKSKIVYMPKVHACRMFISFNQPLYIHFHATGGYAGVDLNNPSDPNTGIRFENIEFSKADNGFWINTTRVDAYMYSMGAEIWGLDVYGKEAYVKNGDLLNYSDMINKWNNQLGSDPDFAACYREIITADNLGGIIEQPSKLSSFKEGGVSASYFQNYIDQIWSAFSSKQLVCNQGERGIWRGRINNGVLTMTGEFGAFNGVTATISRKPNTQEVIEGKGCLAEGDEQSKALQAQFSGAITRGIINPNAADGATQDWGDFNNYFKSNTYNKYVWFFHQSDVSTDRKSYAFAYDDTFDQSATLYMNKPSKVRVTIGGFSNDPGGDVDPIETDDVAFDNLSNSIKSESSYTVNVKYTATEARDIWICLFDNTGTWTVYPGGESHARVEAGSGVVPVTINLASAPTPAANYVFKCDIRPVDGDWTSALDNEIVSDITITAGGDEEEDDEEDEESGTGKAGNLEYSYSFSQSGTSLTVTLTVTNPGSFTGLVPVLFDKTDGFTEYVGTAGAVISETFTYPPGKTTTFAGKWMYAGGDVVSDDISYTMKLSTEASTQEASNIIVYPNPTNGLINIIGNDSSFLIYDSLGRVCLKSVGQEADLSGLSKGTYYLRFTDGTSLHLIKK